ncbi:glycosyltransferase family 2 protein [Acidithiobacillus concretivorus]|uniref:Glycosyltransferase n=1 Tax=Acidithiobacillus concretivorus TaxID=3063952 RepID=A0ABS5ZSN2_9PROT|nr:glycosyltransferase family 2 protein [Acidithiobacillus concretivorus]MBU2739704.1 glycosyltransferase [Acidithiobacillus concretivorus]
MEWWIERLPRRLVSVRLVPQENVAEIDGLSGEYKGISEWPSLSVEITSDFAKGGWFYLEAALVRHTGDREARFFGKSGDDACTEFEIPISSNLRGSIREVFYLPGPVATLFWSPMRAPGFFSQSHLLVHRISGVESFFRRTHRVVETLVALRGSSGKARGGLTWRGAVFHLQDAYIRTARLKIQRYHSPDYGEFLARHDTIKAAELNAIMASIQAAEAKPVICLMVLLRDAEPSMLAKMLTAVRNQLYPHWELLLGMDGRISIECRALLENAHREDARIILEEVDGLSDMAAGLNALLQRVNGDFFAVLNQHDLLPEHAFVFVAKAIQSQSDALVIYADHDRMDDRGCRYAPHFKPDWNPDFFTAYDYMGNLRLWHTKTVRRLGGFRRGFDGAECYDLTLRCIAHCTHEQIVHIPRVLCHSRDLDEQDANMEAGLRAVSDHFERLGAVVVAGDLPGIYRVCHPIPSSAPLVSILIPTRDKLDILQACVESVQQRTDYGAWEVVIVDNGSVEAQTLAWFETIQQDPRIRVISYPLPFNYSAINNFAVEHAQGEVIVLLNNDIEVIRQDWLTEMVGHALRPEIGAVGAKLLYPNNMVQHAGVVLGIGGVAGHVHRYLGGTEPGYYFRAVATQNYSVVTAACLAVRKSVFAEVGGLDAINLKVAFNDVDFCLKLLKAGYRNVFTPYALLYHHESLSRGHDDTPDKKAIFEQEFGYMKTCWGKRTDPAYNPNLSLEFEDFSLKRF